MEWVIDAKIKVACQTLFLAWEYNTHCLCGHWSIKCDFKGMKDFKIKKIPNTSATNYNSSGGGQFN